MRAVADSVIQHNGAVIGVLPHFFDKHEVAHENITEMIIVNSMSERKEKMAELSDAFIALPGGYGTLDELFEVLVYSDGKEFIDAIETEKFDLVFLDLLMPVKDGFEVLKELKHRDIRMPVIVLSAVTQRDTVIRAFQMGIKSYLTKPLKPEDFLVKSMEILRTDF